MAKKEEESENDEFLQENTVIFKKYKPIVKLGHGSFGNIYKVIRLSDQKEYAVKIEKKNCLIKYLESEAYHLFSLQKGYGFPKLITYGKIKKYNILIETLLGKSLYNIYFKTENICNLTDACLIGLQILDRLEYIHSKNLVYRDVKPENFLIGIDDPNIIYIIDFGLCKKYRSSKTGKHILPKLTKRFNGTISYVSSNVFKGKEASRRDDLISLGYMILYLIRKNIPNFPLFKDLNRQQYYEILFFKESYDEGKLFKGLPQEINEYIKYTKNLKFEQDPDYSFLRSLFTKILSRISFNQRNIKFSWIDPIKKELIGIPINNSLRRRSPISK
jgi:serine/threonine protein kinase